MSLPDLIALATEQLEVPQYGPEAGLEALLGMIVDFFIAILPVLAVIAVVVSGILYLTAAGNPQRAEVAKKNLLWAVTGAVILLLVFTILVVIEAILRGQGVPGIIQGSVLPVAYASAHRRGPTTIRDVRPELLQYDAGGLGFLSPVSRCTAIEDIPQNRLKHWACAELVDFEVLAIRAAKIAFSVISGYAAVVFLWAAFLYLTAYGNEERAAAAKRIFYFGVVGTAVMLTALVIIAVFLGLLGVTKELELFRLLPKPGS